MTESLGVGMVGYAFMGAAHSQAWRTAPHVFDLPLRPVLAVLCGRDPGATAAAAERYGFAGTETDWRALLERDDVQLIDVCTPGDSHAEISVAALEAGKHVLCEKPLAPSVADGQAMADRAAKSDRVAAVGFTFRRSPAINAVREQVTGGTLGPPVHFNGHYWCDYGFDRDAPMSWRYRGGPGSGVLADIGTHVVDVGEFLCGPVESVRGAVLTTVVPDRPVPLGVAVGHAGGVPVSDTREAVGNEDIATFTATFAARSSGNSGAVGTFSVSRIAYEMPNALGFEVFCRDGAAAFDLARTSELTIADRSSAGPVNGYRQVLLGPAHPYIARGLPMDFPSVGHGQSDFFTYQARAFLDEIAGRDELPRCPGLNEGLHNLRVLDAVVASAHADGRSVTVEEGTS